MKWGLEMRKKIVFCLFVFLILSVSACSTGDNSDKKKNELEKLGLSDSQAKNFENYTSAVSNSLTLLYELDENVVTRGISNNDLEKLLQSTKDVEDAYLDCEGKRQEDLVRSFQDPESHGIYGTVVNMKEYKRNYTLSEAYIILGNTIDLTEGIIESYTENTSDQQKLKEYFLSKLDLSTTFEEAETALEKKEKE